MRSYESAQEAAHALADAVIVCAGQAVRAPCERVCLELRCTVPLLREERRGERCQKFG